MALLVVAACAESPTAPASSLNESPNLLIGQSPLAPIRLVSTMKDGVTIQRVLEIPVEVSIGSANIGAGEWFALRTGTTFHAPDGGTHVVNPKVDPAADEALRSGKPVVVTGAVDLLDQPVWDAIKDFHAVDVEARVELVAVDAGSKERVLDAVERSGIVDPKCGC